MLASYMTNISLPCMIHTFNHAAMHKLGPGLRIMLEILPIMLLSNAQKSSLLCSKLCFQNQDYT